MSDLREMVENLARMTKEEQEQFVEKMVETYPELAEEIHTGLGYGLLDRDFRKEINEPYEPYEQEFDGTAYWGA